MTVPVNTNLRWSTKPEDQTISMTDSALRSLTSEGFGLRFLCVIVRVFTAEVSNDGMSRLSLSVFSPIKSTQKKSKNDELLV